MPPDGPRLTVEEEPLDRTSLLSARESPITTGVFGPCQRDVIAMPRGDTPPHTRRRSEWKRYVLLRRRARMRQLVPPGFRGARAAGVARPSRWMPSVITVDSPPGMISASRPSRSSGRRTSRACAPSPRTILACASKSPWRARIPTVWFNAPTSREEPEAALTRASSFRGSSSADPARSTQQRPGRGH